MRRLETTGQQQTPPPCHCDQQLGNALPWILVAMLLVFLIDRWNDRRRKKKDKERDGTVDVGAEDGGKK